MSRNKENLSFKSTISVAIMLFGMFFGAGNLIFPVFMGQLSGKNIIPAILGFVISGVGLPMLGVVALGKSRSNGLHELSSKVSKRYGYFFTCALYLTIGPFFAIPRCASTSFSAGMVSLIPGVDPKLLQLIFTMVFFGLALFIALKPGNVLTSIGKVLTPAFLVCLGVLILMSLINPMGSAMNIEASGNYANRAFSTGIIEGYNTMDALAGLAFGIVVVRVIQGLGIKNEDAVARNTMKAGVFSCIIMAIIYGLVTLMGARSLGSISVGTNGSEALNAISNYYFGTYGTIILVLIVTLACFKTATGLIISCGQAFEEMFPKGPKYKTWAIIFAIVSFGISNVGLNAIIEWSIPVLMFLYPLAITLILLSLMGKMFNYSKTVYLCTTAFALVAAVFDFINAMPEYVVSGLHLDVLTGFATKYIPLFNMGLGWITPSVIGFVIGLIIYNMKKK